MQKRLTRCLALFLALSLLFVLSACQSNPASTPSSAPAAESSSASEAAPEAPEAPASLPEDQPADSTPSAQETVDSSSLYPIYEEPTTIDAFIAVGGFIQPYLDNDFNNVYAIAQAEQATNVHVDWSYVDQDMFVEKFQLLVASEDYPDIWASLENFYTGGTDALVHDGVCIDIVPYLDQYMPDYKAMLDSDPLLTKMMMSDSGYMTSISGRNVLVNQGCEIRKDWLDDLGLEIPKTYDELHEVLTAFKNEKGATNSLLFLKDPYYANGWLSGGYGVLGGGTDGELPWQLKEDGKTVACSFAEPGYEEYLGMLAQWYQEGLFTDDFIGSNNPDLQGFILKNSTGFWYAATDILGEGFREQMPDLNAEIVAISDMTRTGTETVALGGSRGVKGDGGWSVSGQCEDPGAVLSYMNWFFTEEGTLISNWGKEGETYTVQPDGSYAFTDLILNNQGMSTFITLALYTNYFDCPFDLKPERKMATLMTENERGCFDIWTANRSEDQVYQGFLAQDEGQIYNQHIGDIATYAYENVVKFILGNRPMSEYKDFVDQLYSMGLQELVDLKQAAYDRYCAR